MAVLYLDVLFGINFVIDTLLLGMTARLRGYYVPLRRRFLGGAVGGLLAVGIFWLPAWVPDMLLAGVCCAVMMAAAWGWQARTRFWGDLAMLWMLSMLISGGVMLLTQWGGAGMARGSAVYLDLSFTALLGGTVAAYGLLSLCCRPGSLRQSRREREVCCGLEGRTVRFRAFEDTGNLLRDGSGRKVLLISPSLAAELLGRPVCAAGPEVCFLQLSTLYPVGLIPCRTANGGGLLVTLRPDRLEIDGRDEEGYILGLADAELAPSCGCRALIGC